MRTLIRLLFVVLVAGLTVLTAVSTRGAPAASPPPVYHQVQMLYGAPYRDQRLGYALAAREDLVVAGAPWRSDDGLTRNGIVYFFERPAGAQWYSPGRLLLPPDWLRGGEFGRAVALDGGVLAVSALLEGPANTDPPYETGAVFLFSEDDNWQPQATIVPPQLPEYAGFARQIDLDGDTLIVMADAAAYLYERHNGGWTQAARLDTPLIQSVTVAGDVALIGAMEDTASPIPEERGRGRVDVYIRQDGVWSAAGTLAPDDGAAYDRFGCAIDFDGATAVVAACAYGPEDKADRAYLFAFDGENWTQTARLEPTLGDELFGVTDVAYDGQRVVLTAFAQSNAYLPSLLGAAFLFEQHNGAWTQTAALRPDDWQLGGSFATAVVLAGGDIVASAPTRPVLNMAEQGVLFVFRAQPAAVGIVYAPVAAGGELAQTGLIVFQASVNGGASDLYLIGGDGRGRTQLTDTPANEFDAAWSPDGRRLIFVRDGADSRQLVIMELDGRQETILPTPGVSVHGHPDWSRDGTRIVFDNQRGPYGEIYVVGIDGSGMKNLTETLLRSEHSPVWSPDGTRIAYVDEGQLSTMDADGGNAGPLGIGNQPASRPDWSPDGQFILYGTADAYGLRDDILVVTADGGAQTDEVRHARHGRWSADGLRVVFAGESGGIFHIDLDTYHLIVIQNSPLGDMPDWQP